jgi:hypothetical protein
VGNANILAKNSPEILAKIFAAKEHQNNLR